MGRRLLPLKPWLKPGMKVGVIGPQADDNLVLLGNYHGRTSRGGNTAVTPLQALRDRLSGGSDGSDGGVEVEYAYGCAVTGDGAWPWGDAITLARDSDVAIVFMGSSSKGTVDGITHYDTVEKESLDRRDIGLPGQQQDLLQALTTLTTTPIVLVLVQGGAISVEWAHASDRVGAILSAWYPGEQGGNAIADVLLGDQAPAGRMPVTTYFSNYTAMIKASDMRMRVWPGRTYRFVQVPVLYEFGYGLSYSKFQYGAPVVAPIRARRGHGAGGQSTPRTVSVMVSNVGSIHSDEVVLLFVTEPEPAPQNQNNHTTSTIINNNDNYIEGRAASGAAAAVQQRSNRRLVGFKRLHAVAPGERREVVFTLEANDLAVADEHGVWSERVGQYDLHVGVAPQAGEVGEPSKKTGMAYSSAALFVL